MMLYFICILIAAAVVLADFFTKAAVVAHIPLGESVNLIDGVFRFTYIQNRGAAFGMLSDARWVFLILSTVAIVAIVAFVAWKRPKNKLMLMSLSLIVGGGIGNMIDRVRLGYVVDFLDFCAFPSLWKWIFNVADAAACIGAGLLFLYLILDTVKTSKEEKAAKFAAETENKDADGND